MAMFVFLATLVSLDFIPVSRSAGRQSFKTSTASFANFFVRKLLSMPGNSPPKMRRFASKIVSWQSSFKINIGEHFVFGGLSNQPFFHNLMNCFNTLWIDFGQSFGTCTETQMLVTVDLQGCRQIRFSEKLGYLAQLADPPAPHPPSL